MNSKAAQRQISQR